MKKLFEKWNSISLIFRILGGIILGVIIALIARLLDISKYTNWVGIFGTLFTGALKALAPILVFVLVLSSISNAKNSVGKNFTTVILLYLSTTLLASIISVCASFIFKLQIQLEGVDKITNSAPSSVAEVMKNLLLNLIANPITSLAEGNYLGILFWSILLGIAFRKAGDTTKNFLQDMSSAVSTCVRWVISFAPFGVLGLVYTVVSEFGLTIFVDYGLLVLLLVGCMLFVSLVINPIIASITIGQNAYPLLFRCLKESGITAFFTRSSAANIPVNMKLCENLGLNKDSYSVSIPLGATINMDGAAITIAIMSLVGAFSSGVEVHFWQAIILSFLATIAACGASGVAGGSLLLIPLACSLLGVSPDIAMQMVGVGFIIGVIQDSLETALNSSGDVMFTACAEFREWKKQGKEIKF